jgi:hypothetical protein
VLVVVLVVGASSSAVDGGVAEPGTNSKHRTCKGKWRGGWREVFQIVCAADEVGGCNSNGGGGVVGGC